MPYYQNSQQHINRGEIDISKVFKIISIYKWLIIFITLSSILIATIFLYFQPSIYDAYTIIKVKDNRGLSSKQMVFKPAPLLPSDIKEDIALLKTFYMHNQALNLNRVNLEVQYYIDKNYKKVELFSSIPIKIKDIKILDEDILGKKLLITPTADGYTISFKHSFWAKIKSYIFGKNLSKFKKIDRVEYNKMVITKYFKFRVEKFSNFNKPIVIVINGNHRNIYEHIIKNSLKVEQIEQGVPIIKISYKDNIQKRAISYIDSLTDSFIKESIKNKSEQSNKILEFINRELNIMKEKLKKSEKGLEQYQIKNSATKPSLQASSFIEKLGDIEIELSENELRDKIAQNLTKLIYKNYSLDAIAPSLMELGEEPTLKLIEILQESQLQRDLLLADFTKKHPKVIAQQNKIDRTKSKIVRNIKNLQRHISQKNRTLKKLKISYENKIKALPTKERKLINIKRDYEVSSKMYNFLLEKQAENEIIKVATLSDYKIIDKAYSSRKSISPNFKMTLIASILLGVIIGLVTAFIFNSFDVKIREKRDIENITELPIYSTLLEKSYAKLVVYDELNSPFTESYRTLRSKIQLLLDDDKNRCKSILITSTISGEGKNITTANLSAIFQLANYKVVAIDLDMRRPTLDKLFEVNEVEKGVSSYLKEESTLHEIIYPTRYKNLNIIPVGDIPSNPSELILSTHISKLIENLKKEYNYIIINSAPFGTITDSRHIMRYSDINLILFRENYSKKTYISNLNSMVEEDEIKNIGIIYLQNSKNNVKKL
jgi:capsular exopolysaccharide synthesis family protein